MSVSTQLKDDFSYYILSTNVTHIDPCACAGLNASILFPFSP